MTYSWYPPLCTARLTLRAIVAADRERHGELFGDAAVVRYLYEEPLVGAALDEHLLKRFWRGLPVDGGWCNLAVEREGEYVGEVGVGLTSVEHRQAEVGYVFLPRARGLGYATEATRAMVDLAVVKLGAHRVVGRLDGRNVASAAVLERLGLRREATFRQNEFVKGEWTDEVVYATLASEWTVTTAFD